MPPTPPQAFLTDAPERTSERRPRHLHSLDSLRGIAALAVVIFHYKDFLHRGDVGPTPLATAALPFARFLWPMFEHGYEAVPLFFTLSGFVFFWLYSQSVASRAIDVFDFFVLRFSRLYPLHFATLIAVTVLEWCYAQTHEIPFFVSPLNDTYHFILHLFFASNWFPSSGFSFNFPVWSVSIEVLLYAFFFIFCRFTLSAWLMAVMAVAGWWLVFRVNANLGAGIGSFFAGGLTFLVYRSLTALDARWTWILLGLTVLIWLIGAYGIATGWAAVPEPWLKRTRYFPIMLMYPSLVLSLAMLESTFRFPRRIAWLGDTSYATYMLHFPLQLVFVLVADRAGLSRGIFYSPAVFLLFFAVLLPLSLATYRVLELPAQKYLRTVARRRSSTRSTGVSSPR